MLKIKADKREKTEKIDELKEKGFLPAVFYGAGQNTTSITISEKDFEKIWKTAGESSTVTLLTPDGEVVTLIHEIQLDPVKHKPYLMEFLKLLNQVLVFWLKFFMK